MSRALSTYLDGLRVLAALWVFLGHVSLLLPAAGLPPLWWTAEDAVMGFFVLSGFVIAYTAEHRHATLRDYAAARLARLWSVAVPALVFAFVVDRIGRALAPELAPGLVPDWMEPDPLGRLLAGLVFVNELWFGSLRAPSNVPYWSIGYEAWYYVLFGCAVYLRGARRAAALVVAALIAGPKILLLVPVWLMGVAAWRVAGRIPPAVGWILVAGSIVAYFAAWALGVRPGLAWRAALLTPSGIDLAWSTEFLWKFLVGAMAAANLAGFAAISRGLSLGVVERPVAWLAGMSFSLYLFHWPLLLLVVLATARWGPAPWPATTTVLVIAGVLAAVAALAELSERRKHVARRAVEALLSATLPARPKPV